jgi:hypothetical protein
MPDHRGDLWIANSVTDRIQGEVHEHLPLEAIPLHGDVPAPSLQSNNRVVLEVCV